MLPIVFAARGSPWMPRDMTTVETSPKSVQAGTEEVKPAPSSTVLSSSDADPSSEPSVALPDKEMDSTAATTTTPVAAAATVSDAEPETAPVAPLTRPGNHAHSSSFGPMSASSASSLKDTLSIRKASSTTELARRATDTADTTSLSAPIRRLPSSLSSSSLDDQDINTLPDPRLRAQKAAGGRQNSHPEDEITALSTKLIDAINYQSTLDDTLSQTRMELEEAREKVRKLEQLNAQQKEFLAGGVWVRKSAAETEKIGILASMREEKRLRAEAEAAKAKMELELESLTAELFQQANTMVAAAKEEARAEQLAAARRYDNLKAQLADTEGLLKSQQDQLAELKQVMEEMIQNESLVRDDETTTITTPTSPSFGQLDFQDTESLATSDKAVDVAAAASAASETELPDADAKTDTSAPASTATAAAATAATAATVSTNTVAALSPSASSPHQVPPPDALPLSPSQPMSFTHLLRPVLRFDTPSYYEFVELIRTAQVQLMLHQHNSPRLSAHVRSPSSTSLPKTPPMATTGWNANSHASNTSTAAPAGAGFNVPTMIGTSTFASVSGLTVPSNGTSPQNHTRELKESKFYKRVIVEDLEPTLRLDLAPGFSWLVRRNIMSAILEGTLVAEPVPNIAGAASLIQNPCSMCGENRCEDRFLRHHRFRITESDKSAPYPLCNYCLHRVRSVGGFLVFLRMIKEGHWRCTDEEAEQSAWEECVRLREHMFWCRIGGGVLPASGSSNSVAAAIAGSSSMGSMRHSRLVASSSNNSIRNSISLQSNAQLSTEAPGGPSSGGRPSGETSRELGKLNTTDLTASSPLSSPSPETARPDNAGETNTRPPTAHMPNRSSRLTASMAAMVSGLGGHVP